MTTDEAVVDQVLADALTVADRLRTDPAPDHVDVLTLGVPEDLIEPSYADISRLDALRRPRPRVQRLPRPTKPRGVKTRFPPIKLNDPGFWLGAIAPVVIFFTLLVTMAFVSDPTVQSVLALSAGAVGAVYVAVTALALASRLGVNTDDIVKLLDQMTAVIAALKQEVEEAKEAAQKTFELKIVEEKLASGGDNLEVNKGESVKLTVQADADCTFYLVNYVPDLELKTGVSQDQSFTANAAGVFAFGITNSAGTKSELGKLTVSEQAVD